MNQTDHLTRESDLTDTICALVPLMRQAVDQSLALRKQGQSSAVTTAWEEFLGEFLQYVKRKGNDEGENLLSELSMTRILSQR